ncbi:MAG: hypothetical protein Q4E53_08190 [Eubacteriales bacterium]|nr:hypothetical protein [Eubacteriales bacterium]
MNETKYLSKAEFRNKVKSALNELGEERLAYDHDEFWMIEREYAHIEYYAMENQLFNTSVALPVARAIHNGTHRKGTTQRNGKVYRLPYVIHCLLVCRMLLDMDLPLSKDELDIVLAASLCHDMIEDIPFPNHGKELIDIYGLDPQIYETVKYVSKRKDFTEEEHQAYFDNIQSHKLALLVKLSDRGHNVEDLYNMKGWKLHEYVDETNTYFLPMAKYGKEHYRELYQSIEILLDKICSLTEVAETFLNRYEEQEKKMIEQLQTLREENEQLWATLRALDMEE